MVSSPGYVHEAIFVGSEEELVTAAVPFLREALDAGEPVGVACSAATNAVLCTELENDPRVVLLPHGRVYRDAQTAVGAYRELVSTCLTSGHTGVRLLGEVDFAAHTSWHEWALFEAASDDLLASTPVRSGCIYDTRTLSDRVLLTGELSHPYLRMAGHRLSNPHYVSPAEMLASPPLDAFDPVELTTPSLEILDVGRRSALRQQVRDHLGSMAVFPDSRIEPLVLAVHEVAGNGLVHGRGPVDVRVWVAAGRAVCTVTDRGRGFSSPPGRLPAKPDLMQSGPGLGLYIVRELVDEFNSYLAADGFVVRLGVDYASA